MLPARWPAHGGRRRSSLQPIDGRSAEMSPFPVQRAPAGSPALRSRPCPPADAASETLNLETLNAASANAADDPPRPLSMSFFPSFRAVRSRNSPPVLDSPGRHRFEDRGEGLAVRRQGVLHLRRHLGVD